MSEPTRDQMAQDYAKALEIIARLRASNEELLAALKVAELWLVNCVPTTEIDGSKPLPVLRAAIAKAEHG